MEELNSKYIQLVRGYKRLKYAAETYQDLVRKNAKQTCSKESEENELIVHRDSVILRFNFSYDLTWKFFKVLLRDRLSIEVANPRSTFQECAKQSILTPEEAQVLLEMIRNRNEIAHVYDEELADMVSKKILEYNDFLQNLAKKLALILQESKYL